jgi:hypothetical protein
VTTLYLVMNGAKEYLDIDRKTFIPREEPFKSGNVSGLFQTTDRDFARRTALEAGQKSKTGAWILSGVLPEEPVAAPKVPKRRGKRAPS